MMLVIFWIILEIKTLILLISKSSSARVIAEGFVLTAMITTVEKRSSNETANSKINKLKSQEEGKYETVRPLWHHRPRGLLDPIRHRSITRGEGGRDGEGGVY